MSDFKMDYNTRSNLIGALASEFDKDSGTEFGIETSNYIENTKALDATAMGLPIETLKKTKSVIEQQEKKYAGSKDVDTVQFMAHLKVAKKCVEEIIAQKSKKPGK